MKISDDFETSNRTILEIIQDIINQVLSIINKKAHTYIYIYILYFSFDRVTVYFLAAVSPRLQILHFYSYNFLIQITLSVYFRLVT